MPTRFQPRFTPPAGLRVVVLAQSADALPIEVVVHCIAECLDAVFPAIPYCIDLIGGPRLETDPAVCVAFRPKGA